MVQGLFYTPKRNGCDLRGAKLSLSPYSKHFSSQSASFPSRAGVVGIPAVMMKCDEVM